MFYFRIWHRNPYSTFASFSSRVILFCFIRVLFVSSVGIVAVSWVHASFVSSVGLFFMCLIRTSFVFSIAVIVLRLVRFLFVPSVLFVYLFFFCLFFLFNYKSSWIFKFFERSANMIELFLNEFPAADSQRSEKETDNYPVFLSVDCVLSKSAHSPLCLLALCGL